MANAKVLLQAAKCLALALVEGLIVRGDGSSTRNNWGTTGPSPLGACVQMDMDIFLSYHTSKMMLNLKRYRKRRNQNE